MHVAGHSTQIKQTFCDCLALSKCWHSGHWPGSHCSPHSTMQSNMLPITECFSAENEMQHYLQYVICNLHGGVPLLWISIFLVDGTDAESTKDHCSPGSKKIWSCVIVFSEHLGQFKQWTPPHLNEFCSRCLGQTQVRPLGGSQILQVWKSYSHKKINIKR